MTLSAALGLGQTALELGLINALTVLDDPDEVGGIGQRFHGAGVKPGKSAAQQLYIQQLVLQIHFIEGRDLQFPSR